MIADLKRRLAKSGWPNALTLVSPPADSMGLADLAGKVDFTVAMPVVSRAAKCRPSFWRSRRSHRDACVLTIVPAKRRVPVSANGHRWLASYGFAYGEKLPLKIRVQNRPHLRKLRRRSKLIEDLAGPFLTLLVESDELRDNILL
jgi:hypothetical protein